MSHILVSGLINLEVTLQCEGFPIQYTPVRYPFWGVNSTVSGVGYNVAKALAVLGDEVRFLSLIGQDSAAVAVKKALDEDRIPAGYVLPILGQTPQSVIIYDPEGRRQINVDLKDIQERPYPPDLFEQALAECSLAVLANVNFSRGMLLPTLKSGKPIATDVHVISDLNDDYNRDFMSYAHILFMSNERLPCSPEEWAAQVRDRFGTEIIAIGLGKEGVLLSIRRDNFMERIPAVQIRPIKNTVGAGDALFSAFVHFYAQTADPYESIKKAVVFASYKIGANGGAEGFLSEAELNAL